MTTIVASQQSEMGSRHVAVPGSGIAVKSGPRRETSEVRCLLAPERTIPALPVATRARLLARARAAVAGSSVSLQAHEQDREAGGPGRTALMFVIACVAGTALGMALSEVGTRLWQRRSSVSAEIVAPAVVRALRD